MPVNEPREDYKDVDKAWKLVRDVVKSDARRYVKDIDPTDPVRCKQYRDEAQFTNFTTRTKAGLVGAVFRRPPIITIPAEIEYIKEDATGYRMPLEKLCQECVGEVLMTGRYGLLVDYPASDENLSQADITEMNLKARIYRYTAESIINWQEKLINGVPILSLVVLKECYDELGEDGFQWISKTQYRVLRLLDGEYVQYIYDGDKLEIVSFCVPKDASGNSWEFIPFVFIGSEDNDSDIDFLPLYDLAMLNIGHLRNSADYEESVHIVGQPTLFIQTEMTDEQFIAQNPNGVMLGVRKGHNLGVGGKAELLQAAPNQLADEAMKRKEEQAIMVGARLISKALDRETATAAKMRHSGETSILSTIANNVEQSLELCCDYIMRFMTDVNATDSTDIQLNNQYFDKDIDPNLLMAEVQMLTAGIIGKSDVRQTLRAYGLIDQERTDSDIETELTTQSPVTQDSPPDPLVSEE